MPAGEQVAPAAAAGVVGSRRPTTRKCCHHSLPRLPLQAELRCCGREADSNNEQQNLQVRAVEFRRSRGSRRVAEARARLSACVGVILCVIGGFLQLENSARLPDRLHVLAGPEPGLPRPSDGAVPVRRALAVLAIRRSWKPAAKCLPLMFVLFLPILVCRNHLYEWMNDPALTTRQWLVSEHAGLDRFAGCCTSRSGLAC